MSGFNNPSSSSSSSSSSSYNSVYLNPLNDDDHYHLKYTSNRKTTSLGHQLLLFGEAAAAAAANKENVVLVPDTKNKRYCTTKALPPLGDKTNLVVSSTPHKKKTSPLKLLKSSSSSLQLCMQLNEPDSTFGLKLWDHSDSAPAPASSWSTLPNRYLLCMPLPVDIGRCSCFIVKEAQPSLHGGGGSLYTLYTNEGHGRQDRKLAVAHHRRRSGRSEFTVALNTKGLFCSSDECILGTITANFMGSKYHIWDQGSKLDPLKEQSKLLIAVVGFVPTISTCTGTYRSLRAWIPKPQSTQCKNTSKFQHINGLPKDWAKMNKTQQLYSRVPNHNNYSRQYELDFRERGRAGLRVQSSVKNFQLTMEENGSQTILQLGRVGESRYMMDYRYPLTGYQAFCICLASMDPKLCCTV